MRVLFDQATPVPIREFLVGHTVHTAAQQHWDTLKNGELLTVAEHAGFEVFLTTDKNMQYQTNMAGRTIAVVVIGVQQVASPSAARRARRGRSERRDAWLLHRSGHSGRLTARPYPEHLALTLGTRIGVYEVTAPIALLQNWHPEAKKNARSVSATVGAIIDAW